MGNEFEHHDYYDEHPLDFEKIESGELSLDVFARSRIHRLYLEFVRRQKCTIRHRRLMPWQPGAKPGP